MSSKDEVLALLERNRGSFLSGQEIARGLLISRNAVWKAINALRGAGYRIEAVTNRGYRLSSDSDVLSSEGIAPYLTEEVDSSLIHVFDQLVSTNETAKEMALKGAPHGTVVTADMQTGGRGRRDHSFYSPSGGIYVSFILRPDRFPYRDPATVTAYMAVAVVDTVKEMASREARIKPVNDIFLDGKKICGILTESVSDFESGEIGWIAAGIGLNYRLDPELIPEELKGKIGSVFEMRDAPPRNAVLGDLIVRILCGYRGRSPEDVMRRYRERLLDQPPALS